MTDLGADLVRMASDALSHLAGQIHDELATIEVHESTRQWRRGEDDFIEQMTIEIMAPIRSPTPGIRPINGSRPMDQRPTGIAPSMRYAKCAIHGSRLGRRSPAA